MRFKLGPIDFTQPTTWRGLLGFAGLFGVSISPELADKIAIAVGMGLSAIEVFRDEYAARHALLPPIVLQSLPAAVAADRLRQPMPPEPETAPLPESSGFGDR